MASTEDHYGGPDWTGPDTQAQDTGTLWTGPGSNVTVRGNI